LRGYVPDEAESFETTSDLQQALRSSAPLAQLAQLPLIEARDAYHRITAAD
jgi:hypothetical protein